MLASLGCTHQRRSSRVKGKINYFRKNPENNGEWEILNGNQWNKYHGSVEGLKTFQQEPVVKVSASEKKATPKPSTAKKPTTDPAAKPKAKDLEYDPVVPTLAQEVARLIPTPVLRQILEAYQTGDKVGLEITVTTSKTYQV